MSCDLLIFYADRIETSGENRYNILTCASLRCFLLDIPRETPKLLALFAKKLNGFYKIAKTAKIILEKVSKNAMYFFL